MGIMVMLANRRLQLEEDDEVDGEEVHEMDGRLKWRNA
jgi:hypothetical protein